MTEEDFMRAALAEARIADKENEIPVGAVAVLNGEIIAGEHNRMEQLHDATAHAEVLLIRKVSSIIGDWRLSDVTIYVTKEPCFMCGGAMVNAHLKRVVYGLRDPRSGADALGLLRNPNLLYQIESTGGIMEEICKTEFQNFFRKRRHEQKIAKEKNEGSL
jgi:tRNA(adenine34) deaminase